MKTINAKELNLRDVNTAIKQQINGHRVIVTDAEHIHGVAAGLKVGDILIQGDSGDYLGMLADGVTIEVTRNAGKYAADNMTRGQLLIQGNAGFGAAQYCYGGTVVIYGGAEDFTGTMNKGATIIVAGDIGDEAATYMLDGQLIVVGNAGFNLANYLIRGAVYIGGEWKSLGHNTHHVPMTNDDESQLRSLFERYGIEADPSRFKKIIAASKKPFYN